MVETVAPSSSTALAEAALLLHDFNLEYDEPSPPPDELAVRVAELIEDDHITVLIARDRETGAAVGVAVMRVQPSVWSRAAEAYLAKLYVVPGQRGAGYGRELITEAMRVARERGADYAFVITSEDDLLAQRLYEAAGLRRTEGEGGPLMMAYERDLQVGLDIRFAGTRARWDSRWMSSISGPPFDQLLATAEAVATARPEVDLEMAREVFQEAATLLHNGLALDGLDDHDAHAVVAGLCIDLVAEDPGAAVRARSRATS